LGTDRDGKQIRRNDQRQYSGAFHFHSSFFTVAARILEPLNAGGTSDFKKCEHYEHSGC
jgi:hypothetical protein